MTRHDLSIADHLRPTTELLAAVDSALRSTGIQTERWQDSVPEPPRALADRPYKIVTTRLHFDRLSLESLTAFTHRLLSSDPALHLSSLHLRTPSDPADQAWNAEVGIAYFIADTGRVQ